MKIEQLDRLLTATEEVTVRTFTKRGVSEVLPDPDSLISLMGERPIKAYLGIDPTAADLHIGHTVPLRKLAQLQELGHQVILLFGTFTAMIGDPTDKSAARKVLTKEQVRENMRTYTDQAGKVLDLSRNSKNPITIKENGEWLAPMTFAEVVGLAAHATVQQLMQRSMFQERVQKGKGVGVHELLYPLMQGQDSVAMKVDVEVGGTDQTFNMLTGRELMRDILGTEKWVVATKLIEDPNGQKMGKTTGNIVALGDSSAVKHEAFMTWPDSAIPVGFELLTLTPVEEVKSAVKAVAEGRFHPKDFKTAFALRAVAEIDGLQAAREGEVEYDRVYSQGQLPSSIPETRIGHNMSLNDVLVQSGLTANSETAKTLIANGAVWIDGKQARANSKLGPGALVQLGKRTIKNIRRIIGE